jgi:response regulator RpfG family c-di-GMP phosphodiesterase
MAKRTWKQSWEDFQIRLYLMKPEEMQELIDHVKFAANHGPQADLAKLKAKKQNGQKLSQMEAFKLKELIRLFERAGLPTKN